MKTLKFSLLGMLFVTGILFAMEQDEAVFSNLTDQNELWKGIKKNDPEKVKNALANGADPNEFRSIENCSRTNVVDSSPLGDAIEKFYDTDESDKSLEIVRYLLNAGADPDCVEIWKIWGVKIEVPVLCTAIRYPDITRQVFPLIQLLYSFVKNPYKRACFQNTDKPVADIDDIKKHISKHFLAAYSFWVSAIDVRKNLEEDWTKIAFLLAPEIVLERAKETYGNLFSFIKKRELGISPRNKTPRISTLSVNCNDNSESSVMNDENINNDKEEA